ncbi:MAG: hypothetical protein LBK06_04315, partial [Planctomycetaceae bacterium]|nr:hypothetical protein [Planctomycetaceae bacterium]
YIVAGKAIGFALEQSLHVVALPCSALRILKRLQHRYQNHRREYYLDHKTIVNYRTSWSPISTAAESAVLICNRSRNVPNIAACAVYSP